MVDIICAFLSYIEFNKVDINHKCCISDWYGHDIATQQQKEKGRNFKHPLLISRYQCECSKT